MNLTGKTVLITGGRRVGSALAQMLSERGASVALTYHTSRAVIEATVSAIEARGGRALAVAADLTRAEHAAHAVEQVLARFGHLDVLVNMASLFRCTPLATLVPADFDSLIAANLAAAYHTSIAAARQMLAQPSENGIKGKIVNVGDWATERPYRGYLPYLVGKGALTTLTLALAKELAPHITVNLVQPAMIDPPPTMSESERSAVVAATPLKRVGSADDINRLILYLLEGTDFATGAAYRVDGGRFLGADD